MTLSDTDVLICQISNPRTLIQTGKLDFVVTVVMEGMHVVMKSSYSAEEGLASLPAWIKGISNPDLPRKSPSLQYSNKYK